MTLPEILRLALEQNSGFQSARQSKPAAHGRHHQAVSGVMPQFKAYYSKAKQSIPSVNLGGLQNMIPGGIFASETVIRHVEFSQPVIVPQAWHNVASSRHSRRAADLDVQKATIDLIANARQYFYDLLLAGELVKVQQDRVAQVERELELSKAQVHLESAPRVDEIRSEVQLANTRPDLIQAVFDREISEQRLANLLGLKTNTGIVARGEFLKVTPVPSHNTLLKVAILSRPDVAATRERWRAAQKTLKAAQAGYLPTVNVVAAYDKTRGQYWPLTDDIEISSAKATVNLPVFDGLMTEGKVKEARALATKARYDLVTIERSVELDITQAVSQLAKAVAVLKATEAAVKQAKLAQEICEEGYRVGARTHLEVLDSELSLTMALTNRLRAHHDYSVAMVRLDQAQGLAPGLSVLSSTDRTGKKFQHQGN